IFVPKCLLPLTALVAQEQVRYAMTGILVAAEPGDHWRLTATDGRVLGIARGPSTPHSLDEEAAGKLPPVESLVPSAIVPVKDFAAALKAVPKPRRNDQARQAGILLSSPEVILTAGESVFRASPVEGRFPDANAILPKRPAPVSFKVNPELFCLLLKAAA